MSELLRTTQQLPDKPTAADTADWYRLGDAVEKHGRHMKRQAVAAEYISGRNMEAWYREIGLPSDTGRGLLSEARSLGLCDVSHSPALSEALPTARAAREYAKAEPEIREVIKEQITLNGKVYTAAEIKALSDELSTEAIQGRIAMNDRDKLREQLQALTQDTSSKDLEQARKAADALFNSIQVLARDISKLSTNFFTHNDPHFIQQIGEAITDLSASFNYKSEQVVLGTSEPPTSYSGGATGSEVRVIDITHSY
jgi:hypothetical protein